MIRVTLPHERSFSLIGASELSLPAGVSRRSRSRSKCSIVCAIPARDVVIGFGKFQGSKMGSLPSAYLRWLVRQSTHSRLAVWGDYAKEVLQDPYYWDRLEWESIEKLARGDTRKRDPPTGDASVKASMQALGWDLSDQAAWSRVNFSLLGTTSGGRIPRQKLDPSVSSPIPTISNPTRTISNPSVASAMEGSRGGSSPPMNPASKSSPLNTAPDKQAPKVMPRPSQSLSFQEELLRRRQLRRERSTAKSLITLPPTTKNVGKLFPGRESLLKKAQGRADN